MKNPKCLVVNENKENKRSDGSLLSFLESLDRKDYPRRSMQDIMAYIDAERDSWEDDSDQIKDNDKNISDA